MIVRHMKIIMYAHIYIAISEKKKNQSLQRQGKKTPELLTLSNSHFPPLSSILMSAECNYIYPPVNILCDTYDTTTKGRKYFANIKKIFLWLNSSWIYIREGGRD